MKDEFARTKNVMRFMSGIEMVQTPVKGTIGMMLAFGDPGTGKSEVGMWYASQNDSPYIRATDIMSRRSLLSKIVAELGIAPDFRTDDLFNQAVNYLLDHPTTIIVDEVDYLIRDGMVEVLRDLNDITNTAIIMIGMHQLDKKLRRFPHLFDRFSAVVKFQVFDETDIRDMAADICEVAITEDGIKYILERGHGKFRLTMKWFASAERIARTNGVDRVEAVHLRQVKMGGAV